MAGDSASDRERFRSSPRLRNEWLHQIPGAVARKHRRRLAVGITAHIGLMTHEGQAGRDFVVNGGQAGRFVVVQIAKNLGAKVITTAGSDEKVELRASWC